MWAIWASLMCGPSCDTATVPTANSADAATNASFLIILFLLLGSPVNARERRVTSRGFMLVPSWRLPRIGPGAESDRLPAARKGEAWRGAFAMPRPQAFVGSKAGPPRRPQAGRVA